MARRSRPARVLAAYSALALGNHTFSVRAVDTGGPDPTPARFAWTIQALAVPDTTITSSPAASTTSTSASFSFTSTPAGATFECSLDGAAFAACTSPAAYSALALGNHTFGVRAVNAAGTDATPATFAWTIASAPTGLVLALGFEENAGTTTAAAATTARSRAPRGRRPAATATRCRSTAPTPWSPSPTRPRSISRTR